MTTTQALSPTFLSIPALQGGTNPASELADGLLQASATLSPKFLYDDLGSALFTAITELPEYYPTRTEAAIVAKHLQDIAAALPAGRALVDLGAGDCAKASRLLLPLRVSRYVAIDISEGYLRQSLQALQARFPQLPMVGVGLDFSQNLALPQSALDEPATVFYPGSSIGNFAPAQALDLLRQAHGLSAGGSLLIGADLFKDADVLEAAYDDAIGVTAAFNLNMLRHVNHILGSDFNVRDWRHLSVFNAVQSRVEMHLEARRDVAVRWPDNVRAFRSGERIHTESSYKWTPGAFESLLRDAGWRHVQRWTDAQGWFGVFAAQA